MNHSGSQHRKLPSLERIRTHQNAHGQLRWLLSQTWFWVIIALCGVGIVAKICHVAAPDVTGTGMAGRRGLTAAVSGLTLVSYSYFEKDAIQLANMQFFLSVGMGMSKGFKHPENTHFALVVSGDTCEPCKPLLKILKEDVRSRRFPELKWIYSHPALYLLWRRENEGMDFAAHNVRSLYRCIEPHPALTIPKKQRKYTQAFL